MLYQVLNWEKNFEGAKSKTYNNKTSCSMPCKNGLGYRKLLRSKNGPALFGAWCALVQTLSRHNKERKGYCTDTGLPNGVPYTADDLELITDIPSKLIQEMLNACSSKAIGWVKVIKPTDTAGDCEETILPLNLDSDLDLKKNTPDVPPEECYITKRKKKLKGDKLQVFKRFWDAFDYKTGKAEASDEMFFIDTDDKELVERIIESAKQEAVARVAMRQKGLTPKMAQGWLSGKRWENELSTVENLDALFNRKNGSGDKINHLGEQRFQYERRIAQEAK